MRSEQPTPFILTKQFRPLLFALAALGTGISVCLTIQFCMDLSGRGFHPIPVLLGVFFEALKLLAIAAGLWLLQACGWRERCTGLVSLILGFVLITTSVAASMGYLVQKDARGRQDAVFASGAYETLTERKKLLQDRLNASREASDRYRELGFVSKSIPLANEASKLSQEIDDVMVQIENMRSKTETTQDFFSGLAILIAKSPEDPKISQSYDRDVAIMADRLRSGSYLLIAIMLEAGCVLAMHLIALGRSRSLPFVISSELQPSEENPMIATIDRDHKPTAVHVRDCHKDRESSEIVIASPARIKEDRDRYQLVCRAILTGELKPDYRNVRDTFHLRQQTVTQFFRQLERDQIVERQGRGFVVLEGRRVHADAIRC